MCNLIKTDTSCLASCITTMVKISTMQNSYDYIMLKVMWGVAGRGSLWCICTLFVWLGFPSVLFTFNYLFVCLFTFQDMLVSSRGIDLSVKEDRHFMLMVSIFTHRCTIPVQVHTLKLLDKQLSLWSILQGSNLFLLTIVFVANIAVHFHC